MDQDGVEAVLFCGLKAIVDGCLAAWAADCRGEKLYLVVRYVQAADGRLIKCPVVNVDYHLDGVDAGMGDECPQRVGQDRPAGQVDVLLRQGLRVSSSLTGGSFATSCGYDQGECWHVEGLPEASRGGWPVANGRCWLVRCT